MIAPENWDGSVISKQPVQFLQSLAWANFQQNLGRQYFFIKNDFGQALVIKNRLPLGQSYLYIPRGPIFNSWDEKSFSLFWPEIQKIARKEKSIFCRFEPPIIGNWKLEAGNYRKVNDVHPPHLFNN